MMELLLLLLFAIFVWFVSKAIIWVVYYVIIYNLVAQAAFLILGRIINFNTAAAFWISRLAFLLLAFWLGGLLKELITRHTLLRLIVIIIFALFVIWFVGHGFHFNYYYFKQPLTPHNFI